MKISVVTITYNDAAGLAKTIASVNSQTTRDRIEYIIVDGASTDETPGILSANSDKTDILISEPDRGIYDAMNKGLTVASGDYVIFMNSGDCFTDSNAIATIIESIEQSGRQPAVVYGRYRETAGDTTGTPIPCRSPKKIWYGPVASHQSTLYHLPTLRSLGLQYDLSYRIAADYKLTLSLLKSTGFDALPLDLCISDFDTTGASNQNQNTGLKEANRARREVLGWGKLRCALLSTALYGARYMKKYMRPLYRLLRNH